MTTKYRVSIACPRCERQSENTTVTKSQYDIYIELAKEAWIQNRGDGPVLVTLGTQLCETCVAEDAERAKREAWRRARDIPETARYAIVEERGQLHIIDTKIVTPAMLEEDGGRLALRYSLFTVDAKEQTMVKCRAPVEEVQRAYCGWLNRMRLHD